MLKAYKKPVFSSEDQAIFDALVPFDCWMRLADKHVDFLKLRASIAHLFEETGRPAIEPILFLKLELLMYHDCLGDSQVFSRAQTDLAYRRFLGLGRNDHLPDSSSLSRFRERLGVEGHQNLFDGLLAQARSQGLVKDRLRIKDATHVLADVAIPAGLAIIASARNKLLAAAEPFDAKRVAGERVRIEAIRSLAGNHQERLTLRVNHLRDILEWTEQQLPEYQTLQGNSVAGDSRLNRLKKAIEIAHKVLHGQDRPKDPGKIRSTVDPDARRGRHGEFYDGYMVDVMIDGDSEFFTAINVLPADGNETLDTLTLVNHELAIHGNSIEQLSIDGAGYSGPLFRELESREIEVYVPHKETTNGGKFTNDQFELSDDESHVTCPSGKQSQYKQRDESKHVNKFRFKKEDCQRCSLQRRCVSLDQKFGRSVGVSDYRHEHELIRKRAQTAEYEAIKREHPRVERRLGVIINRHDGRRARYRGTARVLAQYLAIAMTANLKRMLRLMEHDFFAFGAARISPQC